MQNRCVSRFLGRVVTEPFRSPPMRPTRVIVLLCLQITACTPHEDAPSEEVYVEHYSLTISNDAGVMPTFIGWLTLEETAGRHTGRLDTELGGWDVSELVVSDTSIGFVVPAIGARTLARRRGSELHGVVEGAPGGPATVTGQRELGDGGPMSTNARTYLVEALDLMEARSVNREAIDWGDLRAATLDRAAGARDVSSTYGAIWFALRQLGDGHSRLHGPGDAVRFSGGADPVATRVAERLGYLTVPAFSGTLEADAEVAQKYHDLIEGLVAESVCGWIVDLRSNTGGGMHGMLSGLGPILGEGELLSFTRGDSVFGTAHYQNGAVVQGTIRVEPLQPHPTLTPMPPVAVLTGPQTASAGEAVAVAFRGRPGTRSFGAPTQGLSTGNAPHRLSDGAVIALTEGLMTDRTGVTYGSELVPDELHAGDANGDMGSDVPLAAALEWLLQQSACASPPIPEA